MKKIFSAILLLWLFQTLVAQVNYDCESVLPKLKKWEERIAIIDISNPDKIPLHFLFVRDINTELQNFYDKELPQVVECTSLNFNDVISRYDKLLLRSRFLLDTLKTQNAIIDQIFYHHAIEEFYFKNYANCYYFLGRALEYNPIQADAILLKLELLYQDSAYADCLSLLETLYNKAQLNEMQEHKAMDFTAKFYDKLYSIGDSLVKEDHAAEALEIFKILEIFCLNMPSSYCNDDYYHGIIRSKKGVYESYLEIARIAREREHYDIEARFIRYAQEYANENQEILTHIAQNFGQESPIKLLSESGKPTNTHTSDSTQTSTPLPQETLSHPISKSEIKQEQIEETTPIEKKQTTILNSTTYISTYSTENIETKQENLNTNHIQHTSSTPLETTNYTTNKLDDPKIDLTELQAKYNHLVELGLQYCRNYEYKKGRRTFLEAQAMEQNTALEKDGRVKIMLKALDGIE